MKYIFMLFYVVMLFAPFVITYSYLSFMHRMSVITVNRHFKVYAIVAACLFYVSFFFGEFVIPIINEHIYAIDARIMGIEGYIQDIFVPISLYVPLFYLLNYIFGATAKHRVLKYFYVIVCYGLNYIVWGLLLSMSAHKIY